MAAHPILILCSFAAFVDRTNVSFASLTMNKTQGFSSAVYGLGAGIFFWGYCLFEIPSNLILAKVGARLWIARILITWGIISGVTGFVWSPTSFYTMRFLLGLRSGLLSGDHPLSHLVVPETLSGTRDRAVHDRDCRIGDTGIDHFPERCFSSTGCLACTAINGCS